MKRKIRVVGAAIVDSGRCFVAQRPRGGSASLKWEFPGGKLESEETPTEALRREVLEELGVHVQVGNFLGAGQSETPERIIVLEVYSTVLLEHPSKIVLNEHVSSRWVNASELKQIDWATADLPIVPHVEEVLGSFRFR